mmetsp:Transcript_28438/g.60302  ORF Transcript_28438/g.60302 Transcript_28438/m.60302 type:complete len:588 (+) Transcript_28438:102-1865(+)
MALAASPVAAAGALRLRRWDMPYNEVPCPPTTARPTRASQRERGKLLQRSRIARPGSQPPIGSAPRSAGNGGGQGAVCLRQLRELDGADGDKTLMEKTLDAAPAWTVTDTPAMAEALGSSGGVTLGTDGKDRFYGSLSGSQAEEELQRLAAMMKGLIREFAIVKDSVWHLEDTQLSQQERLDRFEEEFLRGMRSQDQDALDRIKAVEGGVELLETRALAAEEALAKGNTAVESAMRQFELLADRSELQEARLKLCEDQTEAQALLARSGGGDAAPVAASGRTSEALRQAELGSLHVAVDEGKTKIRSLTAEVEMLSARVSGAEQAQADVSKISGRVDLLDARILACEDLDRQVPPHGPLPQMDLDGPLPPPQLLNQDGTPNASGRKRSSFLAESPEPDGEASRRASTVRLAESPEPLEPPNAGAAAESLMQDAGSRHRIVELSQKVEGHTERLVDVSKEVEVLRSSTRLELERLSGRVELVDARLTACEDAENQRFAENVRPAKVTGDLQATGKPQVLVPKAGGLTAGEWLWPPSPTEQLSEAFEVEQSQDSKEEEQDEAMQMVSALLKQQALPDGPEASSESAAPK